MIEDVLITYGPMGAMLAWFMIRTEKVINNNTSALNKVLQIVTNCTIRNI